MTLAVTGIDLSEGMLARGHALSADLAVDWVRGDMREMALARRYRSAFMAGHAFQAMLTDGEQTALFGGVARHLEPGGVFAFTSRNPRERDLYGNEAETFWHSFTDTEGRRVDVSTAKTYDPGELTCDFQWDTGDAGLIEGAAETITLKFSDNQTMAASGFLTNVDVNIGGAEELNMGSVSLKLTGDITWP